MSVDIRFNKNITLNMLREQTDFELEYFPDTKLWVASKRYEFDNVDTSSVVNGVNNGVVSVCPYSDQYVQLILEDLPSFDFASYNDSDVDDRIDMLRDYNHKRTRGGTFDIDGDKRIIEFTTRGCGSLMIRDISKIFQAKFLTDAEIDELFYLGDEIDKWDEKEWDEWYDGVYSSVMSEYGLCVNKDGIIIDSDD